VFEILESLTPARQHRHRRAFGGKGKCGRLADATAGTGDQGHGRPLWFRRAAGLALARCTTWRPPSRALDQT
jgi:hypothetical protein